MAKLYVLVRQDLPKNYQAVQAGHAVAEFVLSFPMEWKNETLVYLRAENETELCSWVDRLHKIGCKYAPFYEPDLNDETTALAFISTPETDKMTKFERLV